MAYLLDTNVWIALTFSSHPWHGDANRAFSRVSADEPATFCRATQLSFLRIITTSAVQRLYRASALTNREAIEIMHQFLAIPTVDYAEEPSGTTSLWHELAGSKKTSPKLWMDAYLAAFAMAGGFQFVTIDKGFRQFKRLDLFLLTQGK